MQEVGFEEVKACVLSSQNTAAQYIVMKPILDLCEEAVQWTGTRVSKRWWKQEGLDLVGAWVKSELAAAAALEGEP